ncbi:MAG: hypothetical protein EDM05_039540 [Leptolyngbya sp. IPPAS B-1204]
MPILPRALLVSAAYVLRIANATDVMISEFVAVHEVIDAIEQ